LRRENFQGRKRETEKAKARIPLVSKKQQHKFRVFYCFLGTLVDPK
jgi:hypothetical protein